MSLRQGNNIIAGIGTKIPLFSFMWSDYQLNDISWLRADTFSWQTGGVNTPYKNAYQHLVGDITGKTLQSETIGSTTIQFYLADDGHKICPASEESNVVAIYNATGVAWYYIIDTVNQQFKLPRINPNREQLLSSAPVLAQVDSSTYNSKQRIVHNISGSVVATGYALGNNGSGFSTPTSYNEYADLYNGTGSFSGKKYLYFYIGEFAQSAIENTAGLNTEMFNELNAHKVIEFQAPTAANNYTWYRKYADGWVEQGGILSVASASQATTTLPVTMLDANYTITNGFQDTSGTKRNNPVMILGASTTSITLGHQAGTTMKCHWQVSGMAA